MNPLTSIHDLKSHRLHNKHQKFYFVVLINKNDITPAGRTFLKNLDLFDLDTGRHCDYFLPGFANDGSRIIDMFPFGASQESPFITRLGALSFDHKAFWEFYDYLETRNNIGWRYSGGCEFLLLEVSDNGSVISDNFISYNLDDILRNNHSLSEFVRATIKITLEETDKQRIKNRIDEIFYELIIPSNNQNNDYLQICTQAFQSNFENKTYCFISYSSKDFHFVKNIRRQLINSGYDCWMAPFDIPSGANYAYVIELAIKNASKFLLMLSENAVNSVWVGKELKRAINRFQTDHNKISVVWLDEPFDLQDTPLALPLEDIQIAVSLHCNSSDISTLINILSPLKPNFNSMWNGSVSENVKLLARIASDATLKLDGSTEKLQCYLNAVNSLSCAEDFPYREAIKQIYSRLCMIIYTCQSNNRGFDSNESKILMQDANMLFSICSYLIQQ